MKYPPKHHQEQNFKNIVKLLKAYPFGTLITVNDNIPFITHIPLIYENDGSTHGKLLAHIDKYNPQVATLTDGKEITAIFYGPDCYISPSVYSTQQLPTWNYLIVHLKGTIVRYSDKETVKQTIIDMTSFLEGNNPKYSLEKDNPRMAAALDYIVGFEIKITSWEGKYKFSQDKKKEDRNLAKEALIQSQQKDVRVFLEDIIKDHHQG